ncbi:GTPase [Maliponia aquimaris]|uniref:GTPase Era n=1 Tax=Maliponia aquimaris TaxID=1673631 RepID=A0A238L4Y3_9RHOB|nr:GTPase [Maliponia aquimaris]SMX50135.1 GTPase Era [Maliponia aquimaris]
MTSHIVPETSPNRTPRIALMGEFSAGKSTLANLLLGQDSSPVQVTATQLPPVWYRAGAPQAQRITAEGDAMPLPLDDWRGVRPGDTRMISVTLEADLLHACELIDMPGTSDPNMVPDFWQEYLPQVDLVIWCTPANQAWRQSEAALWEQVPPQLWTKSLLLITRWDKLQTERDRARVLARVKAEAGPLFREVLPIALTQALAARDDDAALADSGAAALVQFLCHALDGLEAPPPAPRPAASRPPEPAALRPPEPVAAPAALPAPAARPGKIVPRRITRARPDGETARAEARPH